MKKLQVLVGPIASGKSTYARNAAKKGILCINDDAIVNMIHGDNYTLYNKDLKILYKSIENVIISFALLKDLVVLIDRGLNVSVKARKRWLAIASSFDVACEAIVFKNEGPEIHARRRSETDHRGYDYDFWLKAAERHHFLYKEPTLEEGFDVIYFADWKDIEKGEVVS